MLLASVHPLMGYRFRARATLRLDMAFLSFQMPFILHSEMKKVDTFVKKKKRKEIRHTSGWWCRYYSAATIAQKAEDCKKTETLKENGERDRK